METLPTTALAAISLHDFNWPSGAWTCERDGELMQEQWSSIASNSMVGMFRWLSNDLVSLLERQTLSLEDSTIALRIKHFTSNLK